MNEVTKIHLGRQPFTISLDAHQELKSYLGAIKKQVKDDDVIDEVELRMAELLAEHGITDNKVILSGDVDFLKAQLGNPQDFTDEDETSPHAGSKPPESKRLFRDTDNAMIAGVASGLAQYFGIDVLLVRIFFVIAVFVTFGWGILLYIVLWLLVPEATTASDRLQMAGKPVNVNSLKEIAQRADIKSIAQRANTSLAGPINAVFRFLLKLAGLVFVISGLSVLFGLIAAMTYFWVNHDVWAQDNIFPVGSRENLLLYIAVAVVALTAFFVILFGVATFRRKWPIRPWATGVLIGLTLIALAVGGALAGDVYPNIRDRYNANIRTSILGTAPFTMVNVNGPVEKINFETASTYSVGMTYYGHPNLGGIKTTVQDTSLLIDTTQFDEHRNCQAICIPDTYDLEITVYAPNATQIANQFYPLPPIMPALPGSVYHLKHESL